MCRKDTCLRWKRNYQGGEWLLREFLKDQPWDWSDLIFPFIILAHTNILTQFSDDTKLLDFVNAKVSWKNLEDIKDLDDLESWSNGNGIKYSSAKCKVMHLQTNEKRLFCELEDYQLRITEE